MLHNAFVNDPGMLAFKYLVLVLCQLSFALAVLLHGLALLLPSDLLLLLQVTKPRLDN